MTPVDEFKSLPDFTIPARILIGVTGHRKLGQQPLLIEQIHRSLEMIKDMIPSLTCTPVVFTIISPLAQGADCLVAREVLKTPGSQLEAVLPLEKDDYLKDFTQTSAKAEFEELLSSAYRIKQLTMGTTRNDAYLQAGRYVVDHSDVLIALWNGKNGSGNAGTAETVAYARAKGHAVFWIHTEDPTHITFEQGQLSVVLEGTEAAVKRRWGKFLTRERKKYFKKVTKGSPFLSLDQYNAEKVAEEKISRELNKQYNHLLSHAEKAKFSSAVLQTICQLLLPHYVRADFLAVRYQGLYLKSGSLLFTLSAAAVGVVAFQGNYTPKWPQIIILEMLLMIAILAVMWLNNSRRWHQKWIDYRFLAERFRSAIFMSTAHVDLVTIPSSRPLSSAFLSTDWMVAAFASVWSRCSHFPDQDGRDFAGLKNFLISAWVQDQISFHEKASKKHSRKNRRMELGGIIFFVTTFIAAVFHVLQIGPVLFLCTVAFMINVFPSFGAALGAVRTHREYLKNSIRSDEMVRQLYELQEQMMSSTNFKMFFNTVRETEQTILREMDDWHIVVKFRDLDPA